MTRPGCAVSLCNLQMITVNFEDYPEHRLKFFALLHAITNHCFACLFAMSPPQLKLLIDSIVWAFRHTERNVAETGLLLLEVRGAWRAAARPAAVVPPSVAHACVPSAQQPRHVHTAHTYTRMHTCMHHAGL